jgi:hypothetical protein
MEFRNSVRNQAGRSGEIHGRSFERCLAESSEDLRIEGERTVVEWNKGRTCGITRVKTRRFERAFRAVTWYGSR